MKAEALQALKGLARHEEQVLGTPFDVAIVRIVRGWIRDPNRQEEALRQLGPQRQTIIRHLRRVG